MIADQPTDAAEGYELIVLLMLALRTTIEEAHARLADKGFDDIRPAHGFAFQRLAPNGATGNELAEHLGITKQAASEMIDYLEARGYVTRRPHPSDGRGKIVALTTRGWDCIEAAEGFFSDVEQRWTETVGVDSMAMLRDSLRRIVAASGVAGPPLRLRPVW